MLGFVSMFMDISSELVHSLLPIFMATTLGVSMITIGIVEGFAEAAAAFTKVFSGMISDYFRKRKLPAVIGYGLAAITKPIFPLATSISWVFGARFIDRVGKGIRGAPRDALVAEIAPARHRGAAYGLRQALDSVGAFIGPLLAIIFMFWFANDINAVLWVAVIPGFIAVFILIFGVREPKSEDHAIVRKDHLRLRDIKRLHPDYWFVVAIGAAFTLARFSEAFLILRAQDVGLAIGLVPVIMIVMNIVYSIFAYPAGAAADRFSARILLLCGLVILIVSDLALAVAMSPVVTLLGSALWGLHMAITQGLLSKLVADTAPTELYGTAFGIFNLINGGALLAASVVAGTLWSQFGPFATFVAGALFAAFAAIILLISPSIKRTMNGSWNT